MTSRLLKQHPEQEATTISDCLDLVTRASQKVTNRIDVIFDRTVTDNLVATRLVGSRMEATQIGLQGLHRDVHSIQVNQDKVQEMILNSEDARSKGFDTLVGTIDGKIERATSRLEADMRVLQALLHNIFHQMSYSARATQQGESHRKSLGSKNA